MLTTDVREALEFCHNISKQTPYSLAAAAAYVLAKEMLRLYPPGWDDPVTPERLVELGGLVFSNRPWCVSFQGAEFAFSTDGVLREISVAVAGRTWPLELSGWLLPRNMKEARELLKRFGAIKEAQ